MTLSVEFSAIGVGIVLLQAFWLMFPAYVTGSIAVLVGGGKPIDFGKKHRDGRRILGDGKTWAGLAGGTIAGIIVGSIQNIAALSINDKLVLSFGETWYFFVVVFCLSFGAMFGDLVKSFIKRRMNIKRGKKSPFLMDQLDFVVGAWFFLLLFATTWFFTNFTFWHILAVLILTPLLHRFTNVIGYKLGKKEVPW
ncbi:MAG: CDP-2,3-bis-(O-geranylgeranyl)-sn-glycerol synthase [Thermoplasmata archaeon]